MKAEAISPPCPAVAVLTAEQIKNIIREVLREHVTAAPPTAVPKRQRVTIRQAAEELGCCERQVHRLRAIGSLQSVKIGSRVFITQESIDKLVAEAMG